MKAIKLSVLILPLVFFFPQLANAQQMMTFDASSSLMLQEFQTMLVLENDEVIVRLRMGREEAKEGVDRLEQGDVILMMNGKRATDIETLRSIYDGIEKDQEIKIGVRRGNERFILNAIKGDVPETPGRMMITTESADGIAPTIVPELGIVIADQNDNIVIQAVLDPILPEELKEVEMMGKNLISIDKKTFENAEDAKNYLAALEVGAEIEFMFGNEQDEQIIMVKKTEPRGNMNFSIGN